MAYSHDSREGLLERRGPGVVGKWEVRWFRVEDGHLTCFHLDHSGQAGQMESCTALNQISKLGVDAEKRECFFCPPGTSGKMRLRTNSEDEAAAWFAALQYGQVMAAKQGDTRYDESQDESEPAEFQSPRPVQIPSAATSRISTGSAQQAQSPPRSPPREPSPNRNLTAVGIQRIVELHELHQLKMARMEHMRMKKEAEEIRQIEEGREGMRQGTRSGLRQHELDGEAAADRLYGDHKETERRKNALRMKYSEEERQKVEDSRFRRPERPVIVDVDPASAGVRLYEAHRRKEYERQVKKEEEAMMALERTASRTVGIHSRHHEKLYEDANHRREQMDKKIAEARAAEAKRLASEQVSKSATLNPQRFEKLHGDHEEKLKKNAQRVAQHRERELQECQSMKRPQSARRSPSEETKIWERGGMSPYFSGGHRPSPGAKKPVPAQKSTHADVVLAAVLHAVELRCGDGHTLPLPDAKDLLPPLREALEIYSEAHHHSEQTDGSFTVSGLPNMRLFRDGFLLAEGEGFEQCREPYAIRQVSDNFGELLFHASRAQVALQEIFVPPPSGSRWPPGSTRTSLACIKQALFAYNPGVKQRQAAEIKAKVHFQPGDGERKCKHLLDLARLALVFPSCALLQAGLEEVIARFEVVQIRNNYATPSRLGGRCIEVLIVLKLHNDDGTAACQVCELRLEDLHFNRARQMSARHLEEFEQRFRILCGRSSRDMDCLAYVMRSTLHGRADSHALRVFRRHLAQTYGSIPTAWRRLGCGRLVSFEKFRDICHKQKCWELAPQLWCELDPGSGGCISLFELAPEAVSLCARARAQILGTDGRDELNDEELFDRLAPKNELGHVEMPEFCGMVRALGFNIADAKRIFRYLDFKGAKEFKPPAGLAIADVSWLRRLSQVVDLDAVVLGSPEGMTELEALQLVTRTAMTARNHRIGATTAMQRNSKFNLPARPNSARSPSRNGSISQRELDTSVSASHSVEFNSSGEFENSEQSPGGDGDASAGIVDGPAVTGPSAIADMVKRHSERKESETALDEGKVTEGFGAGGGLMSPRGPRSGSLPRESFARRLSQKSVLGERKSNSAAEESKDSNRENMDVVEFQLRVESIDYAKLCAKPHLQDSFESAVKECIAAEAGFGVQPEHVQLILSAGSVVVDAVIYVPQILGVKDELRAKLNASPTLVQSVASRVAQTEGMKEVSDKALRYSIASSQDQEAAEQPDVKEVFDTIDKNKDGNITQEEMQQFFQQAPAPEPAQNGEKEQPKDDEKGDDDDYNAEEDKNVGDGDNYNAGEDKAGDDDDYNAGEDEQPEAKEEQPDAKEVFAVLDKNNDGTVTQEEMQQAFTEAEAQPANVGNDDDDYNDDYNADQNDGEDDYNQDDENQQDEAPGADVDEVECW